MKALKMHFKDAVVHLNALGPKLYITRKPLILELLLQVQFSEQPKNQSVFRFIGTKVQLFGCMLLSYHNFYYIAG